MNSAPDPAFDALVSAAPIVDMIGDSRMEYDGPGVCTCDDLPAGHDDAQCAAATWERAWPADWSDMYDPSPEPIERRPS